MTHPVETPAWTGLTIVVGDHTHLLPLYEDDRLHETMCGADCVCAPTLVGQTFGERRHEPPRFVHQHNPIKPETKQ